MIYLTQLIYLQVGKEAVFHEFESVAIPIMAKYGGKLLFRIRPDAASYVESTIERPYEIHFISFESEADLQAFLKDETRKHFFHLKEQSIRETLLIKGIAM